MILSHDPYRHIRRHRRRPFSPHPPLVKPKRRHHLGWGETVMLALVIAIFMSIALRWRGWLVIMLPPPWSPPGVTVPDPTYPYRLRHPPTITRTTYRTVLESIRHPMAPDADKVYDLLAYTGVDPAIALAIGLLGDLPPEDGTPGSYNLYGVTDWNGDLKTYTSYPEAVAAWVVWLDRILPRPEPPDAPLTVTGLIALVCAEPDCAPIEILTSVEEAVDTWRHQDRSVTGYSGER